MFIRDDLMAAAAAASGLSDFGSADFEDGFSVLLKAYNEQANLTELGHQLVREELIGDLTGRLRVVDHLKRNPEILEAPIKKPVFILGLPRTGTTTLQNMLQSHPDCQVLEYWLGVVPQPRPPRDQWASNPDYQRVAEVLRLTYEADPSLRALHDIAADAAGECRFVFRHLCMDDSYDHNSHLPGYREWFDAQSMVPVYHWYRDVLKLIQHPHDVGRQWVLKYPPHMRCLKELFEVFPDACVIQTHRDPAAVLPSFASLLAHFSSVYEKHIDPVAIGSFVANHWQQRMNKNIADRADLQREAQFCDLQFDQVLSDPVGSVVRAFKSFGLDTSDQAVQAMTAWHDNHPPGRHGAHDYSAGDFGLDVADLSRRFADYRQRFDVAAS